MTSDTGDRIVQTYRLPRQLVAFVKKQAQDRGVDLTTFVTQLFSGYQSYFGLPIVAAEELERDREALKVERFEYFLHVFYRRAEEVQDKGPGFDGPRRLKKPAEPSPSLPRPTRKR